MWRFVWIDGEDLNVLHGEAIIGLDNRLGVGAV